VNQEAGQGVPAVSPPHRGTSLKRRYLSQRKRPTRVRGPLRRLLRSLWKSQRRQRDLLRKRVFRNPFEALKQRDKQVKPHPRKLQQYQSKNQPQCQRRARARLQKRRLGSLLNLLQQLMMVRPTKWTSKVRIIQTKLRVVMSSTKIKLRL
jgi:hypothetical protein